MISWRGNRFGGHHLVGCFLAIIIWLAVLSVIVQATESRIDHGSSSQLHVNGGNGLENQGIEVNESAHYSSLADRLLIFGKIRLETRDWVNEDCKLEISVELGEHVWKQQLQTSSFAFQVPVSPFKGMVGIICIHEYDATIRRTKSLWRQFFIVQDVGVQQLDATLSGNCTKNVIAGTGVVPWISFTCHTMDVVEKRANLHLALRLPASSMMCPFITAHEDDLCILRGALELYPTAEHGRTIYEGITFMEIIWLKIRDELKLFGDSYRWHWVFGLRLLQTWHLYCFAIVFLFLQLLICLLTSFETISSGLSSLERRAEVNKPPQEMLAWELRTSCPSSSRSLCGHSIRSKQGLLLSGDAPYSDAWSNVYHHLSNLVESPVEASCFYYNCTAQYRSPFSNLVGPSGRWSRDSNGRLTRHLS